MHHHKKTRLALPNHGATKMTSQHIMITINEGKGGIIEEEIIDTEEETYAIVLAISVLVENCAHQVETFGPVEDGGTAEI